MLALGDNSAVIHYNYHIGGNDSTESVGNYETGPVPHNFLDGPVNFGFAVGINLTGGLIENQNCRVLQNRSGYNNSLQLSAAKARTLLADYCIITIWQWKNKFVRKRTPGRSNYFFSGCAGLTIRNICRYSIIKRHYILRNHSNLASQTK